MNQRRLFDDAEESPNIAVTLPAEAKEALIREMAKMILAVSRLEPDNLGKGDEDNV